MHCLDSVIRRRIFYVAAFAILSFSTSVALAQVAGAVPGRMVGKPIGVGYMKNLTEVTAFEYAQDLMSRLNYQSTSLEAAPPKERMDGITPAVDEQIAGQAWYMVQGLIPSFEPIYFRRVADVADAKRTLKAYGKMNGDNMTADVKDEGNDCFLFERKWTYEFNAGGEGAAQKYVDDRKNDVEVGGGNSTTSYAVVEKDGKEMVQQTSSWTQRYRFHDNMLFSGGADNLFEMDLPSSSELTRGVQGGKDMGLDVYFDRIPSGIKTLGWSMLNSASGTMMQRRDDEDVTQSDVRSSSIQLGLDVVKALMFDVQEAHGWMRFATDEDPSIRGQLLFETRRNAELQKQLETAASGVSRFAPILRDEAVATIHSCITLPEASPMFQALSAWLPGFVKAELSSDPAVVQAAQNLALTLTDLAETPTVELCVKVGWSEASDGVIYGGLRVGSNEGLLDAIVTLLKATSPPDGVFEVEQSKGLAVLHLNIRESDTDSVKSATGMTLTDIYVAHGASCVWFAVGNENAMEMIHDCIARSESGGTAGRAPLFTAKVDGEAWLALPQDEPVGVGGLLMYLDENVAAFPPGPMMFNFGGINQKPTPFLQRCIELGGNHQASLQVLADRGGLKVDAEIGEVIGNYMLVRMISAQDRMMERFQENAVSEEDTVIEAAEAVEPAK